jgi:acetyl-CoA acetyltransferase
MAIKWPEGKRPVFIGAGHSVCQRYKQDPKPHEAAEVAMMAIKDAGLQVSDIDGLYVWADPNWGPSVKGDPRVWLDIPSMMNLAPWANIKHFMQVDIVPAGSVTGIQAAAMAVALVMRTGHHPQGVRYRQRSGNAAPGNQAFDAIYGHGVGGSGQALTYAQYLDKYSATREEMSTYVLNAHANAQDNPYSVWRGRELNFDDYMNSRLIAYPMCIFDNDMPVDGMIALILTSEDRGKDTPHPGGYISGMASTPLHRYPPSVIPSLDAIEEVQAQHGKNLYASAGMGPDDIDLIHVYDGFSPMVPMWLEAFQFAPRGEGLRWMQGGTIERKGAHPLNTSGGNLGEGRIHGGAHVYETAIQMMGTAGDRQLDVEVALCETGPFDHGASFICTRD